MTTVSKQATGTDSTDAKFVYTFGDGSADGASDMRNLLGGKGAGLAEMSNLGIPVPPGFTITTEVCTAYYELGHQYPPALDAQVRDGITAVERIVGAGFGDAENPLLVSVRSGARVSMPGMMDTVLNLGLNDVTVEGLARQSGDARFAYDSYRRFVAMYGDVVLGVRRESSLSHDPFEELIEAKKAAAGVELDTELSADALKQLVAEFKGVIKKQIGVDFPEDPWEQLWAAVGAVFESWNSERAIIYRNLNNYPGDWGTAVNVQAMVFGNLGDDCATGVAFTRNPKSGEPGIFGEYLVNAQGEDVVAGVRTPQPVSNAEATNGEVSLETSQPATYEALLAAANRLENHFRDMQDIEFTVQQGKLWVLQTRNGKRTGLAMIRIAADLEAEGLINQTEAVTRLDAEQITELLHPVFAAGAPRDVIATGLAASPGAAVGRVVFSADEAAEWAARGEDVILVRVETSPEDIQGMIAARGILTARGGMTSHAAVVARGWGKCCVAGCGALDIDYRAGQFRVNVPGRGDMVVQRGDTISIDGTTGQVMLGDVPTEEPVLPEAFKRLMETADGARTLGVRANADTPEDARVARGFGAEGIGLCRTEHMFFGEDRILAVRQMILADDEVGRRKALAKILPMQRDDFAGILRAMEGYPVTIRLLDPPLHEFLPHGQEEIARVAESLDIPVERVLRRVESLTEFNPMLGHRGVRLAITYPEIYEVQTQAILEAACDLAAEGVSVLPEIMVPLVAFAEELKRVRGRIEQVAEAVFAERGRRVEFTIGTMIELPRAAITARQIAEYADFFSFGTNDLTQTAMGLSRDDAGRFLPEYVQQRVIEVDPFVQIDREGVGGLVEIAVERGRKAKPGMKMGICGEHGGDPRSIDFCHNAGLNYVSCSPYRVLVARLAAGQAALR